MCLPKSIHARSRPRSIRRKASWTATARHSPTPRSISTVIKRLWNEKSISQQQLATQRALVKQDEGVVTSDQGNVNAAAFNLGYARVTSPVDGRAGIRQVDIGNLVQAGQADGIVVVTQISRCR